MRSALRQSTGQLRRGFTLMELVVVLTLMSAVAAMTLPRLGDTAKLRLIAAARVMVSDLETAQVMTLSQPNVPLGMVFDPDTATYWIAEQSDTATPITRDDNGQPYLVTFGEGRASSALDVTLEVSDIESNVLEYDSQGGIVDFDSSPSVTLRLGSDWIRLDISATTGTVTESDGSD